MSRSRRRARHRRPPRVTLVAAPLALGGAVAAVALAASPLADSLGGRGGPSSEAQPRNPTDGEYPDVVMIQPVGGSTPGAGGSNDSPAAVDHGQQQVRSAPSGHASSRPSSSAQQSSSAQPSSSPTSSPTQSGGVLPSLPLPTSTATTVPTLPSILPSLPVLTSTPVSVPTITLLP